MPAYDRVVGEKPPFAYESAKMAAATAIPAAALRRSTLCAPFTLVRTTARYSNGVFGGLNRLLVASFLVGVFFVAPSAALAGGCGGSTSAENVYKECLPSGGGGGGGHPTNGGSGSQSGSPATTPISSNTAKVIKHAGKDSRTLAALVKGSSPTGLLRSSPTESGTTPSAVGSAFDLGSGPTALLIALAGTAMLLLAASGVRGWRRSHRA